MQAQQLVDSTKAEYDSTAHEEEPKDLPVGISIQNLTKIYDEVGMYCYTLDVEHALIYIYFSHYIPRCAYA